MKITNNQISESVKEFTNENLVIVSLDKSTSVFCKHCEKQFNSGINSKLNGRNLKHGKMFRTALRHLEKTHNISSNYSSLIFRFWNNHEIKELQGIRYAPDVESFIRKTNIDYLLNKNKF